MKINTIPNGIANAKDFDKEEFLKQWKLANRGTHSVFAEAVDFNTETINIVYSFKPEITASKTLCLVHVDGWDQYFGGFVCQHASKDFFETAVKTLEDNPGVFSGEFKFVPVWGGVIEKIPSFTYNFETKEITVNIDNE